MESVATPMSRQITGVLIILLSMLPFLKYICFHYCPRIFHLTLLAAVSFPGHIKNALLHSEAPPERHFQTWDSTSTVSSDSVKW